MYSYGTNKAQKQIWGSNGIWTHDLHDTSVMIYQLSYEASFEAGQVRIHFNLEGETLATSELTPVCF